MKNVLFTLVALVCVSFASAQTDTTKASSIDNKVKETNEVRKQQNRDAVQSDPTPRRKMQTPRQPRSVNRPATTTTATNNRSNKSSGNAQPSTTPDAVNTPPAGTGTNSSPNNSNPTGKP